MSQHVIEVIPLNLTKLENSDNLSVCKVFDYPVVANTKSWEGQTRACWLQPDSLVNVLLPQFQFLEKDAKFDKNGNLGGSYARVKARKFLGQSSFGLLVPLPDDYIEGENLFEKWECGHYQGIPEDDKSSPLTSNEVASAPNMVSPKYDLENGQKYASRMFEEGEPVVVHEKLNGESTRFTFDGEKFHVGSRNLWKKEYGTPPNPDDLEKHMRTKSKLQGEELEGAIAAMRTRLTEKVPAQNKWWKLLRSYPEVMSWLQSHPNYILYGESFGYTKPYFYGCKSGEMRFAIFDVMKDGKWLDYEEARKLTEGLPWVPVIEENFPYDLEKLVKMADGKTLVPNGTNIKEGVVFQSLKNRYHPKYGRCKLKIVSLDYLEGKKK